MKQYCRALLLATGLIVAATSFIGAGQAVELNKQVQDGLIAAQAVRGVGADRQLFDGKPVLVVFFASW